MHEGGGDRGGSLAAARQQRQLGGGGCSSLAAVAVRQQWQQRQWQHCNSVTAVAATLGAWRRRGSGSLMAAAVARQW
jgi:hypothetical protein